MGSNIICLRRRLQWRGIEVQTIGFRGGGGGSLRFRYNFYWRRHVHTSAAPDKRPYNGRAAQLVAAVDSGVTVLAVCEVRAWEKYCITPEATVTAQAASFYTRLGHERRQRTACLSAGKIPGQPCCSFENTAAHIWVYFWAGLLRVTATTKTALRVPGTRTSSQLWPWPQKSGGFILRTDGNIRALWGSG